jgi:hypothetical protein
VDHLWYKETQGKISCNNVGQYRYHLAKNVMFNILAPLQSCGYENKSIIMYKHLTFDRPLWNILQIKMLSYVEKRTYLHLLCKLSELPFK